METERLTFEQEQEIERLMALAHLQRMRGQIRDAEDTCRTALEISQRDVKIHEMLGDILYDEGKLDRALAEYRDALVISPGCEQLEKKFAKVTLDIGEAERVKQLAEDMIRNPRKYGTRRRSPALAVISSAVVPGLGQLYNGQLFKAVVMFGAVLLFMVAYALFQHYPRGIQTTAEFLYYTDPIVMVLGILAIMAYIYGLIDAPITADKMTKAVGERQQPKTLPIEPPSPEDFPQAKPSPDRTEPRPPT